MVVGVTPGFLHLLRLCVSVVLQPPAHHAPFLSPYPQTNSSAGCSSSQSSVPSALGGCVTLQYGVLMFVSVQLWQLPDQACSESFRGIRKCVFCRCYMSPHTKSWELFLQSCSSDVYTTAVAYNRCNSCYTEAPVTQKQKQKGLNHQSAKLKASCGSTNETPWH